MGNFPNITPKELVKLLLSLGFEKIRQNGSHLLLIKSNKRVTIPLHNKTLKRGTLLSILRQSGLTKEDIKDFR